MTLLDGIDGVVFDVDGTLLHANDPSGVRGAEPVPGAADALAHVRASGRRVLCFTNGTGRTPAEYAADLQGVGLDVAVEEFMNPAVVAARWISRRHPGATVLVLGGRGVTEPLRDAGVTVVPATEPGLADVVLVGWDTVLTYEALRAACDSIWRGAPFLTTSAAPVFAVNGGLAPGWSGAVVAGIRQTTGRRATTLGKPAPAALREACRVLGTRPARTAVVGDDLHLEIEMARKVGSRALLVLTGKSRAEEAAAVPAGLAPHGVLASIAELVPHVGTAS